MYMSHCVQNTVFIERSGHSLILLWKTMGILGSVAIAQSSVSGCLERKKATMSTTTLPHVSMVEKEKRSRRRGQGSRTCDFVFLTVSYCTFFSGLLPKLPGMSVQILGIWHRFVQRNVYLMGTPAPCGLTWMHVHATAKLSNWQKLLLMTWRRNKSLANSLTHRFQQQQNIIFQRRAYFCGLSTGGQWLLQDLWRLYRILWSKPRRGKNLSSQ